MRNQALRLASAPRRTYVSRRAAADDEDSEVSRLRHDLQRQQEEHHPVLLREPTRLTCRFQREYRNARLRELVTERGWLEAPVKVLNRVQHSLVDGARGLFDKDSWKERFDGVKRRLAVSSSRMKYQEHRWLGIKKKEEDPLESDFGVRG